MSDNKLHFLISQRLPLGGQLFEAATSRHNMTYYNDAERNIRWRWTRCSILHPLKQWLEVGLAFESVNPRVKEVSVVEHG